MKIEKTFCTTYFVRVFERLQNMLHSHFLLSQLFPTFLTPRISEIKIYISFGLNFQAFGCNFIARPFHGGIQSISDIR